MLHSYLLILFLTLSMSAFASTGKPVFTSTPREIFAQLRCGREVLQKLQAWNSVDSWVKHLSPDVNGGVILRTPTRKIGTWIGVDVKGNEASMELIRTLGSQTITFDKNCKENSKLLMASSNVLKGKFTDADLENFLSKNPNGLVYTWSTQMPWSVHGIKEIKEAGQRLGVPVLVLMSAASDMNIVQKLLQNKTISETDTRPHHSLEFYMRGMTMHDPSVLSVKAGSLYRWARPGHESAKLYVNYFSKVFSK